MEVSDQLYVTADLHSEEPLVSIGEEAGWHPEQVLTLRSKEKSLVLAGNGTSIGQPVAGRYTNWAIQASSVLKSPK
jgi:hypothetical protein